MKEKNNKYLIIAIFTIAIVFFGGTLAYWQWETTTAEQTKVTFTVENNFKCSVDGGGDITSSDITLAPSSCTNSKYAIKREITTDVDITGTNMGVAMHLWLEIEELDGELGDSENFKYAITTNPNSCTDGFVNGGTFQDGGKRWLSVADYLYYNGLEGEDDTEYPEYEDIDMVPLLENKLYPSKENTYYLYIWLDAEETNPETQNKIFNLSLNGICKSAPSVTPEPPVLEPGMIPITLSEDGKATTVSPTDSAWYSYADKQWANAVLVSNTNRTNYYESDGITIKPNQPIPDSDILAYYVWIPRYSYKFNGGTENNPPLYNYKEYPISISFGKEVPEGYIAHPAFTFGDNELNGIWVGKFETSHSTLASSTTENNLSCTETNCENAFGLIVKPNVQSLRYNNASNMFYASRAMSASGNPYGLDATKTNTHMMKNSEWGAVAYLSYSRYGMPEKIYANNASKWYTGRSRGALADGYMSDDYNAYGYYTWIGQPIDSNGRYGTITDATLGTKASTTGNVYGVYDMSGGSWEIVMSHYGSTIYKEDDWGIYAGDQSGFSTMPEGKYYDLYTIEYREECTLEMCGGHAIDLLEVEGIFYSFDSEYSYEMVSIENPWFIRGGMFNMEVRAGLFKSSYSLGESWENQSFRLVITNGA